MRRRVLAVIVAVVVAASTAGYVLLLYHEYGKVEIGSIAITGIEFGRPSPTSGSLGAVRISLSIEVLNPGRIDVRVDRLNCTLYVEGIMVGSKTLEDLSVPAGGRVLVNVSVDVPLETALTLLSKIVMKPGQPISIAVKGTAYTKPSIFGLRLPEIAVGFEKSVEYSFAGQPAR